jgi:beta-lactamase class A
MILNRRTFVLASAAITVGAPTWAAAADPFAALEAQHGGRLGVAALDAATGRRLAHRADERFPMCSTFKLLAVAAILKNVDGGQERLDHWIDFGPSDLIAHSPITSERVKAGGMTVQDLCEAAIELGDNTAANLLLNTLGGPAAATGYVRSLGDQVTRIDRNEPTANTCIPGDPRDTTTPHAMMANLQALTEGGVLSDNSQTFLVACLRDCQTAETRIPAGLPRGWSSGDKTGTGANGTANDVAVIYAPNRPSIFVAAYYTGSTAPDSDLDGVLAEVGRIVATSFV